MSYIFCNCKFDLLSDIFYELVWAAIVELFLVCYYQSFCFVLVFYFILIFLCCFKIRMGIDKNFLISIPVSWNRNQKIPL